MAETATTGHPLCPFCGTEMLPEQELSKDHVFVRALGGRVVIMAHRTCNSQSGSAAEGDLQRPTPSSTCSRRSRASTQTQCRGRFPLGRRASLDLKNGSVHSPPTVDEAGDGTTLRIEGTPAEAEKALDAGLRTKPSPRCAGVQRPAAQFITPVSYDTVNVGAGLFAKGCRERRGQVRLGGLRPGVQDRPSLQADSPRPCARYRISLPTRSGHGATPPTWACWTRSSPMGRPRLA